MDKHTTPEKTDDDTPKVAICDQCGGPAHICKNPDSTCRFKRIAREFCLDLKDCNIVGDSFIRHVTELIRETEEEAWQRLSEARTRRIGELQRVLEVLDLEEADENGHDIVGAAQLLAHECDEMGFALVNSARAIEAERNLWKPYTDRWLGLDTALSILRNEECRACLPGDGPEGKGAPHTHRGNCLVPRPDRDLLPPSPMCRRCSECVGENHHWVEHCDDPAEVPDPFVGFACKHCDARIEMCDACSGADEPGHTCDFGPDGPYVCPGCHAVAGAPCAPDCIDAAIARESEET